MHASAYVLSLSRKLVWAICLAAALVPCAWADKPALPRPVAEPVVVIRIEGEIDPLFRAFLVRQLDVAKGMGAKTVIIEIESPGGRVDSSLDSAHYLRKLDWAHTIAYVPKYALSGAAFVAIGCDEIILGPEARLGDAGAIFKDEGGAFRFAPEKIVSHIAEDLRLLARENGYPPAVCEAMVNKNQEVFECTHADGRVDFLSEAELRSRPDGKDWKQGQLVFESRAGNFLEVTGKRAVELRLATATAADTTALSKLLGMSESPEVLEYTWVDTFAFILTTWPVTVLLIVVGLIALYIELHAPGIGLAGIISALCFILFFWSRFLGGTADWLEVALFGAGVTCVLVEIFFTTGTLVAAVTGFLLILASLVMAGQEGWIPESQDDIRTLLYNLSAMAASGCVFAGLAVYLSRRYAAAPMFNRMVLAPPEEGAAHAAAEKALAADLLSLVGQQGVAHTALRPAGKARLGERLVEVTADGGIIDPGTKVRVTEISGGRVMVVEVT